MIRNLFYKNDFSFVPSAADSFILYDDGWFYLYFTEVKNGVMKAYKSKDFASWEDIGVIYRCDEKYWANGRFWCPRVMKYPKDGKYYLYCASSGETEVGLPEGTSLDKESPVFANIIMDRLHLSVLVADSPCGPFKEWTGKRTIEKFYHGESLGIVEEEVTLSSGPIFDFADAPAGWETNKEHFSRNGTNVFAQLDPCPFIDDDGTLYLYFVRSRDMNDNEHKHGCWGVKMLDPVTPDYNTLAFLAQPGYYTVGGEPAPNTMDDDIINEGAFMQKHTTIKPNGEKVTKYYLTYTRCGMGCAYYSACLALADAPLGYPKGSKEAKNGGFVKVPHEYGSPIHYIEAVNDYGNHYTATPSFDMFEATGNACFFNVEGEKFLVSLCTVKIPGKESRNFIVDRWLWEYSEALGIDIPHSNGPTQGSLQPCPAAATGYKNIAEKARVFVGGKPFDKTGKARLNNGYIAIHEKDDEKVFYSEQAETEIVLKFETPHEIRAVCAYNTWDKSRAFQKIDELILSGNNKTFTVKDVVFPEEYYTESGALRPGGAAIWQNESEEAIFADTVVLRFNLGKDKKRIGIADVVILGK